MSTRSSSRLRALLLATALCIPAIAIAQVTVADAWVRGTVAGQRSTGAFMSITAAADSALVAASSPTAKVVEIHEMRMDAGVMRMNAVERLALPAGKRVDLGPGGYHVMLMGLAQPLKAGDTVPITLTVEDRSGKRSEVAVKATVKALTDGPRH